MAIKIISPKAPPAVVFPSEVASDVALVNQQYPKIGTKISVMWGTVELQKYLNQTIFDDRGGRQGFPEPVVSALMRIHKYHESLVPDSGDGNVWDSIA